MSLSLPELLEQFLTDKLHLRDELRRQLGDTQSPSARTRLMDQIVAIDRVMGEVEEGLSGDPLADLWEAQIEAGIEPDLDLTMDDLRKRGRRG